MAKGGNTVHLRNLVVTVGVSPGAGASMAEAASICFEDRGHESGVSMKVQGSYQDALGVEWDDTTDAMRRTWADDEEATEQGACGCAILVVERLAGLRVVERSRKGTGFDWWLGEADSALFQHKARLEVSGIRQGKDKISTRVNQKLKQTTRSNATGLDALVVVVEFGEPVSHCRKALVTAPERLHRDAMEAAEQADSARLRGDSKRHRDLIQRAFDLERQAANLVATSELEPTRSVLHRSAASLALEAGEHREAERLIGVALAGTPPEEILNELRSLLQDVHFYQHLTADGIELEANELEYTLIGGQVGEGIAPSAEFMRRIDILDQLVFRTAERKAGRAFRPQGRRDTEIQRSVELFVKVPRAASFAIGFRLGHRDYLPTMDPGANVVTDMIRCFEHFARSEAGALRRLIPDKDYFESFVRLAKKLAPDGRRVGTVGLAGRADGRPHAIVLKPGAGRELGELALTEASPAGIERITVTGVLLLADSEDKKFGKIDIVHESGARTRFRVDPAVMADIVRPFFETRVSAIGHKKGQSNYLDEINPA